MLISVNKERIWRKKYWAAAECRLMCDVWRPLVAGPKGRGRWGSREEIE
jgi:hypothetical protein